MIINIIMNKQIDDYFIYLKNEISLLKNNEDNYFKSIYILKKLNEIDEILKTNNFKEIKNEEIKEDIKLNNKIKNVFPFIYLLLFSETIE